MKELSARDIIEVLHLEAHPSEGGFFRQNYRSPEDVHWHFPGDDRIAERALSTAIYYLLTPGTFSRLHRLKSDEIFHHYLGDPVCMLLLYPDGSHVEVTLGADILRGQQPQVLVPAGVWQGSRLQTGSSYALMGTTMSPGFDYADYENGDCLELLKQYPERADLIRQLSGLQ
jgi:uncharacterized protein